MPPCFGLSRGKISSGTIIIAVLIITPVIFWLWSSNQESDDGNGNGTTGNGIVQKTREEEELVPPPPPLEVNPDTFVVVGSHAVSLEHGGVRFDWLEDFRPAVENRILFDPDRQRVLVINKPAALNDSLSLAA